MCMCWNIHLSTWVQIPGQSSPGNTPEYFPCNVRHWSDPATLTWSRDIDAITRYWKESHCTAKHLRNFLSDWPKTSVSCQPDVDIYACWALELVLASYTALDTASTDSLALPTPFNLLSLIWHPYIQCRVQWGSFKIQISKIPDIHLLYVLYCITCTALSHMIALLRPPLWCTGA